MRFIVVALALVLLAVGTTAQNEKECTPGETKKEDCNSCFCSAAGIWGCTRMACLSWQTASTTSDTATRVRRSEGQCTPNTTFKKDCNTCYCNSDGTGALCTAKGCLSRSTRGPETAIAEKQPTEQRCTPNTTFSHDCNTCSCSADGTVAACTSKTCLSRSTRDIPCTPGTTYKEKCNTCFCLQDGKSGGCTRKACPPGTY